MSVTQLLRILWHDLRPVLRTPTVSMAVHPLALRTASSCLSRLSTRTPLACPRTASFLQEPSSCRLWRMWTLAGPKTWWRLIWSLSSAARWNNSSVSSSLSILARRRTQSKTSKSSLSNSNTPSQRMERVTVTAHSCTKWETLWTRVDYKVSKAVTWEDKSSVTDKTLVITCKVLAPEVAKSHLWVRISEWLCQWAVRLFQTSSTQYKRKRAWNGVRTGEEARISISRTRGPWVRYHSAWVSSWTVSWFCSRVE